MFVLQIATTKGRGGIVTAMCHYARMFDACGIAHAAIYRGPATDVLAREGVELIEAPALHSPLAPLLGRAMAAKLKARGAPMLALVHSDLALGSVRRLWPQAISVTPCHSDKFRRKRNADLVITLNPAQQQAAESALAGSRARAVLLGNPYVAPTAQAAESDAPPRLVFCGRFIDTKDPTILLRAAAQLKQAPKLCFIGAGPLEASLKQAAAASGLDVSFPGWLAAPFEAIGVNDILVSPSSWEGLPYMIQEALDRGVSVVAADNAGNRHGLGDGAYGALFPAGDAAGLTAVLERVLADPAALRTQAQAGQRALRQRYGAEPFWRALSAELAPFIEPGRAHV
jgi:glycosyltransferase involved in cell wall biosynthesis